MAGKNLEPVREKDIQGLKYFDVLLPLLERLHDAGCERDKAGNRKLHFDQYCLLLLLSFFNPITRSLRGLQQASELRNMQCKLGCHRTSLGSLSESRRVFDPEKLREIVEELGQRARPLARDPRLKDVQQVITLVDGTLIKGLPVLTQAALEDSRASRFGSKCRWHTQFELKRWLPVRIETTEGLGRGEAEEKAVLARALEKGRCYVHDRGYAKFKLFNEIVAADSIYVCRLRDNSVYRIVESRPRGDEEREAGVSLDALVEMGETSKPEAQPGHRLRLVAVAAHSDSWSPAGGLGRQG